MLNIAATFVSPLRQRRGRPVYVSQHRQPDVTASMVEHLRQLPVREGTDRPGLDAYCTFVVNLDNQGHVSLHTKPPAPQPGDPDHYDTFIQRVARIYSDRYADLSKLPGGGGLSIDEVMRDLANRHPSLFHRAAQLIQEAEIDGGAELASLLSTLGGRRSAGEERPNA